jgi:hypothetical protein
MNRRAAPLWIALGACVLHSLAFAGAFTSDIITPTSSPLTISVPDKHFLRIRNFTQEGGSQRGVVTVNSNGQTSNVLAATMIFANGSPTPTSSIPPEIVEPVVIAGPAQVTVTPVPGATLFITYRKRVQPTSPTPTPTLTPIATATPTVTATPTPTPTPTPHG